jgi:hypothetical protein
MTALFARINREVGAIRVGRYVREIIDGLLSINVIELSGSRK